MRKLKRRCLCECGCGELVAKVGNKFLRGHNGRGKSNQKGQIPWNKGKTGLQVAWNKGMNPKFSQECECGCGEMTAPGNKYVNGHNQIGVKQSKSTIKKRNKVVIGQKRSSGNWNPWNVGLTKETDSRVKTQSDKMKDKFKDSDWVRKWAKAKDMKPNKLELYFQEILNDLFPNEWKYVGDFDTFIGGKNPDFININGQKKLIEVFGNYWHREDDPDNRVDHFKSYGFDCLVIWEDDINSNLTEVKEALVSFYNQ